MESDDQSWNPIFNTRERFWPLHAAVMEGNMYLINVNNFILSNNTFGLVNEQNMN